MQIIKTLAEAEKMQKENPFLYLVTITPKTGGIGSMILAMKEPLPLWKVYYIANEANKEEEVFTITNVVNLCV